MQDLLTQRPTFQNHHPLDLRCCGSQVAGNRVQVHCITVNEKKVTTTPSLQFKATMADGVEEDRGGGIQQKWRKVVTALRKRLHCWATMGWEPNPPPPPSPSSVKASWNTVQCHQSPVIGGTFPWFSLEEECG